MIESLFKRSQSESRSVSPFGLAIFVLSLVAVGYIADGIYRDRALQDQLLRVVSAAALCHAR